MSNILEKIIANKRKEVSLRKIEEPLNDLQKRRFFQSSTLSLKNKLNNANETGIVAEFKRKSPSKGMINTSNAVAQFVTNAYAQLGASGVSVLTDEVYFGGFNLDLLASRGFMMQPVPILRKDFVIDEYQIVEAKAIGADIILLIAACLSKADVKSLAATAKNVGLETLLEVHNEEELGHVCDDVDLVGVNNRNLKTFTVDVQTSYDLIDKIPPDKTAIAESGITDVQTIVSLRRAGFKGFLIGETFMKAADPAIAFADFVTRLKAVE